MVWRAKPRGQCSRRESRRSFFQRREPIESGLCSESSVVTTVQGTRIETWNTQMVGRGSHVL